MAFDSSQSIEPGALLLVCAKPGGLNDASLPNIEIEFEPGNKVTWQDKAGKVISLTTITGSTGTTKSWSRLADGRYELRDPTPGAKNGK